MSVRSGGRRSDYEVVLGAGELRRVVEYLRHAKPGVRRWVVISDSTVAPLYGTGVSERIRAAGLGGELFTFPAGEENKNRQEWVRLTDALLHAGVGRDGGVVAVGGGVTGDLAGFVAASFMRGIPVVQVPTSLVAMIDASVGGKTGVDTEHGKNLVGAFHPPSLVLADPQTIATLPREERGQGLAEALKHGVIVDEGYAREIAESAGALLDADPERLNAVVSRSIRIKAEVVSSDELEAGRREILNFGHTIGHALEADSGYLLPHGSAVAIGMVAEALLGERLGITREGTHHEIAEGVHALGLPSTMPECDPARIAELTLRDKKARGVSRVVLLRQIGEVAPSESGWSTPVELEDIERTIAALAGKKTAP